MLFRLREAVELYGYGEYTAGLLNGLSLVGINAEDVELRVVAVRKLLRHAGLSAVVCDDVVGDSEKGARVLGKVRYYNSELGRGVIDVAGGGESVGRLAVSKPNEWCSPKWCSPS